MEGAVYVGDFETSFVDETKQAVFVWAFGLYNIYDSEDKIVYTCNIEDAIELMITRCRIIYFHNLKFDGSFILNFLLQKGIPLVNEKIENKNIEKILKKYKSSCVFSTLIIDGSFYEIKIGTLRGVLSIRDSFKIIPFSIRTLGIKSGDPHYLKGELDYCEIHKPNEPLKPNEIEYLKHDLIIQALYVRNALKEGLTKLTLSGSALQLYKKTFDWSKYQKLFPQLKKEEDIFLRKAYKGGFCNGNAKYYGLIVGKGYRIDANSHYPAIMYECELPYGKPLYFKDRPRKKLWIGRVVIYRMELKESGIPCFPIKSGMYVTPQYIESLEDSIEVTITNVDLELYKENYNLTYDIIDGYEFNGKRGFFDKYLDPLFKIKEEASRNKDEILRTITKNKINTPYGKLAVKRKRRVYTPYLEGGILKFSIEEDYSDKGEYLPIAIFVTSYGRKRIVNEAQKNKDNWLYSDTDSCHFLGEFDPSLFKYDNNKIGFYKLEATFTRAKYLGPKRYIEDVIVENGNTELYVCCCGLPEGSKEQVTFENFKDGAVYTNKLIGKEIIGGYALIDIEYKIRV